MASNRHIDLEFADGNYRFALGLAQMDEIQRKSGVGIGKVAARTMAGVNRIDDEIVLTPAHAEFYAHELRDIIVQGLIGGKSGEVAEQTVKVDDKLAVRLFNNYMLDKPLTSWWEVAVSVIGAAMVGYDPPETGKKESVATGETPQESEMTDGSTSD